MANLRTPPNGIDALVSTTSLDAALARLDAAYPFAEHPTMRWMAAPGTTRADFMASQVPFRFAVEGFSQALSAVLARVPTLEDRLPLWRNIAEEHGHGTADLAHKATFRAYLLALGASEADLVQPCPIPVLAFNQAMLNLCLAQGIETGAAALGAIERAYVDVSAAIARTVHARGWVAPGSQRHYEVHEVLDVVHARDLLALAAPAWEHPAGRQAVATGLALGTHHFWSLYTALLPEDAP